MRLLRALGLLAAQGVIGWIASNSLDALVTNELAHDVGIVVIWVAVIVVGGTWLIRREGRLDRQLLTAPPSSRAGAHGDPHARALADSLAQQDDVLRRLTGHGLKEIMSGRSATSSQYRGRVLDAVSQAPIVGVYVTADREQTRATWTNENGDWTLFLPSGRVWKFLFVHPDYPPTFRSARDDDRELVVRMLQKPD